MKNGFAALFVLFLTKFARSADKPNGTIVISISKLLSSETDAEQAPRMNAIRYLVRGIGLHAIESDASSRMQFRERMHQISDALVDDLSGADLMSRAGVVLEAVEDYNRRSTEELQLKISELKNAVTALTASVRAISRTGGSNLTRLAEIEEQLAHGRGSDVRGISTRLSECLREIRAQSDRERKETEETIEHLNHDLDEALKRCYEGNRNQDPVTGLATRSEAELALAHSGRSSEKAFAAIVVLDRLQAINLRFGKEVGDSMLCEVAQWIQKEISSADRLFRWSGTALLALLARPNSIETVRNEISRIMENKLEHLVQTGSRTILLPIAARWTVFPMMAASRLIYQKLDAFSALPAMRN